MVTDTAGWMTWELSAGVLTDGLEAIVIPKVGNWGWLCDQKIMSICKNDENGQSSTCFWCKERCKTRTAGQILRGDFSDALKPDEQDGMILFHLPSPTHSQQ